MRLSISNIAWEREHDNDVAKFLNDNKVDAIDIAPGKYFDCDMNPTIGEVLGVRKFWEQHGIELVGMQSLLFGTKNLDLFGGVKIQEEMLSHLERVVSIASILGIKFLVFGSPKNRKSKLVPSSEVQSVARDFFLKLGDIGCKHDVTICIEPNPTLYNFDFLTSSLEAAQFVSELKHPNIKMQLDTGTVIINDEKIKNEIKQYKKQVGHLHLSTTNLRTIYESADKLSHISDILKRYFDSQVITIEMLANSLDDVFESIVFAKKVLQ